MYLFLSQFHDFFWHLDFPIMKCLKVSLRLLNSSTKLLHNISLPWNICSVWFETPVLCGVFWVFFSIPLTLPGRLCSSLTSLMNMKCTFLLAFFFWNFFFLQGMVLRNIRHLDLLKSTALGKGSVFLRALHFHLCIAELSLKCSCGAHTLLLPRPNCPPVLK